MYSDWYVTSVVKVRLALQVSHLKLRGKWSREISFWGVGFSWRSSHDRTCDLQEVKQTQEVARAQATASKRLWLQRPSVSGSRWQAECSKASIFFWELWDPKAGKLHEIIKLPPQRRAFHPPPHPLCNDSCSSVTTRPKRPNLHTPATRCLSEAKHPPSLS